MRRLPRSGTPQKSTRPAARRREALKSPAFVALLAGAYGMRRALRVAWGRSGVESAAARLRESRSRAVQRYAERASTFGRAHVRKAVPRSSDLTRGSAPRPDATPIDAQA